MTLPYYCSTEPDVDNPVSDPVNHPPHYTKYTIETLDFILDQQFTYLEGQVVKYICRYKYKGNRLQDLQKAEFYLKRLIKEEQQ